MFDCYQKAEGYAFRKYKKMNKSHSLKFTSSFNNEKKELVLDLSDIQYRDYNKSSSLIFSKQIDEIISHIYNDNIVTKKYCKRVTKRY